MAFGGWDIRLDVDLAAKLKAWEAQYVSEASYRQYRRACAWTMDEVAKEVATRTREAMPELFDLPTPWIMRAFQYKRTLGKGRGVAFEGDPESEVYVMDDQSVIMKYHMGSSTNTRLPGDVGMAKNRILIPFRKNLEEVRGTGDMPAGGPVPGDVTVGWSMLNVVESTDIRWWHPGTFTADQVIYRYQIDRPLLFKAGMPGSRATLVMAPETDLWLTIRADSWYIGTIFFAAGSNLGVFQSYMGDMSPAGADTLEVVALGTPDPVAAGLSFAIRAVRA